jgi:hypothetical protein
MNRVLRFALKPQISFDLLLHPSTITTLPDHRPLSLHTLSEPATHNDRLTPLAVVDHGNPASTK